MLCTRESSEHNAVVLISTFLVSSTLPRERPTVTCDSRELSLILAYLVEEVPPVHRQPGAGHLNPCLNICKGRELKISRGGICKLRQGEKSQRVKQSFSNDSSVLGAASGKWVRLCQLNVFNITTTV